MSDLEKRMTKAEYVLEAQADQIEELEEAFKGLSTTLNGIEKLLDQVDRSRSIAGSCYQ